MSPSGFKIGSVRESAEQLQVRLARERELLDIGRQDILAGRSISDAELDERLERFANGDDLKSSAESAT